jgi:hypothetical protein
MTNTMFFALSRTLFLHFLDLSYLPPVLTFDSYETVHHLQISTFLGPKRRKK